jgi:hypothetical protein
VSRERVGLPFPLVVMVVSAVLPNFWFKKKGLALGDFG